MPATPGSAPKGHHRRCSTQPYVGGVPTQPGEKIWRRTADGRVEQVRSRHQLGDEPETLIVTAGGPPPSADAFDDPTLLPDGSWTGDGDRTSLRRSTARRHRTLDAAATVDSHPHLAGRLAGVDPASPAVALTKVQPSADPETWQAVRHLADAIDDEGGRALVVGGAARDALFSEITGRPLAVKDLDVEVFGLPPDRVAALAGELGKVDETGRQFGVFKIAGLELDVSLPRTERTTGDGHRDFDATADHRMSPQDAALRRDFTINAISFDPRTGELLDPVGGVADLERRRLRHVSDRFSEDPLRVLRGMQIAGRFELTADPATVTLARTLLPHYATLPQERVEEEWRKLLLKGARPSRGLEFLAAARWTEAIPDLAAAEKTPQDPIHHPEGDVFRHTAAALDVFARYRRPDDPADAVTVGLAILCHDLGKATTTVDTDGRITAHGHDDAGVEPTRRLLADLTRQKPIVDQVSRLVRHHMAPPQLHKRRDEVSDAAIRRLADRVGRLDLLIDVSFADRGGRPPLPIDDDEIGRWLKSRAEQLAVHKEPPKPVLQGRDLIALGYEPGPQFGELLQAAQQAWLAGDVRDRDEALTYVQQLANSNNKG